VGVGRVILHAPWRCGITLLSQQTCRQGCPPRVGTADPRIAAAAGRLAIVPARGLAARGQSWGLLFDGIRAAAV